MVTIAFVKETSLRRTNRTQSQSSSSQHSKMTSIIGASICIICLLAPYSEGAGPPSYSTDLETQLREELFTNYSVLQRPSEKVTVQLALNLFTVNSLDIKDQILSTSGYFTMQWNDTRLDWSTNSQYSNVRMLFSNEDYMWRPAIVVENSVSSLEVFSDENTLIRITSSGVAFWTPGGIFQTNCDADITYYPLDTQECSISLTTWAYTSTEIQLQFAVNPFITDHFSENGEWEVVGTETSSETATRAKDFSNTYDRLYFTMKLKRRPLFHILNTILPVLLMASLIVFVFKLPPESGERIGMSLTVLLAYAVYLTLISDSIPRTSLSASILSTYLAIILMLSTLSVIFTIVVLDIYFNHADDEEPPKWIQTLTRNFLVRVAMWKGTSCCKRQRVNPRTDGYGTDSNSSRVKLQLDKLSNDNNGNVRMVKVKPEFKNEDAEDEKDQGDNVKMYSWKEVALILDRCFMYLFIFLVVLVTVICLAVLASRA